MSKEKVKIEENSQNEKSEQSMTKILESFLALSPKERKLAVDLIKKGKI